MTKKKKVVKKATEIKSPGDEHSKWEKRDIELVDTRTYSHPKGET
jgi:hypothetical protein